MQDAFPTPYAIPRYPVRVTAGALPRRDAGVSFVHTLHSTLSVFAQYPLPTLACAFICFAGSGVIGSLLYGVMIGEAVLRTGSHTGTTMRAYNMQMLVQAVMGVALFLFGRGALTWIALQSSLQPFTSDAERDAVTFRAALTDALRQWRPLLTSALVYGGLITLGLLGLSALLRELRLDISNTRSLRVADLKSILNWTLIRAIALIPPDPGSPFTDWIAATRYNLARVANGAYLGFDFSPSRNSHAASLGVWLIGSTAIALLFVAEVLLCLRTAAIFSVSMSGRDGSNSNWLRESLRVSGTHFLRIAAWRWSLRFMVVMLVVATLVLLPALHQTLVVGAIRQAFGAGYWPYHIAQSAYGVGIAFVNGMFIAFGVVFEARMYAALSPVQFGKES